MTSFIKSGGEISVYSGDQVKVSHSLPPSTYMVGFHPLKGFSLRETKEFELPGKIYGNFNKIASRIITTFRDRHSSTGVLLSGLKGTGKTLLAKVISSEMIALGYPTIIVQSNFGSADFMKFMQDIDTPCVVVFDEFEKVYSTSKRDVGEGDVASQDTLLTMLDGVYSSKKLFIMTCNDEDRVTKFLFNRPGRIFYNIRFDELPESFISEYVSDTLINKNNVSDLVSHCIGTIGISFDMVQAIVEEMNRFDMTVDDAIRIMNIRPDRQESYTALEISSFSFNGRKLKPSIKRIYSMGSFIVYHYNDDGDESAAQFNSEDLVKSKGGLIHYKNDDGYELLLRKTSLNQSAHFWE